MTYVYGFCDGNSVHAIAEYQQRFPNHRIPIRRVFSRVYQTLQDTGTIPSIRIAAEHDVNEGVNEEEDGTEQSTCEYAKNCKASSCSPHGSAENTACRGHVSILRTASATSWTWRFCWEAGILQVAQWQSPVASLHCLQMKRNSVAKVSITHTTLMCGQMRIPTPLWKATFNYVLVSMCVLQFWTIIWLVLSSWKVLQERRTPDFCRRNSPALGGCAFE